MRDDGRPPVAQPGLDKFTNPLSLDAPNPLFDDRCLRGRSSKAVDHKTSQFTVPFPLGEELAKSKKKHRYQKPPNFLIAR